MRRVACHAPCASSGSFILLAGRGLLPCMQVVRLWRFVLCMEESRNFCSDICQGMKHMFLLRAAGADGIDHSGVSKTRS